MNPRIGVAVAVLAVGAPLLWQFIAEPKPCQGICSLSERDNSAGCRGYDPKRIMLLRVPKTASSTLVKLIEAQAKKKAFSLVRLPDWESAVPQVEEMTYEWESFGEKYKIINATRRSDNDAKKALLNVLYDLAKKVLIPASWLPWVSYQKFVFSSHVYHLDWNYSLSFLKMPPVIDAIERRLPIVAKTVLKGWLKPSLEEIAELRQIAFVREPISRLASMYWYDRTAARSKEWRKRYVAARGNMSLVECAADADCAEANELRRWCSLQTEFFCGLGAECRRPLNQSGLDVAKQHMEEAFAFVGVYEYFPESLKMLAHVFPTYFEYFESVAALPKEKQSNYHPEHKRDSLYTSALKDICQLDIELYQFAVKLFQTKASACNVGLTST